MQASARLSSSSASKTVIAGVSGAIKRSCYRTSRGKAHAAPLSAPEPPLSAPEPPPKGQKRISKQERRVRIVDFVAKFRATNDGKFPTQKYVRQQVGGSQYTVRAILQELEYNHRKSPLGNAKAAPFQGTDEVSEHSRPKDEAMVDQLKGTPELAEHARPNDDSAKNPYNCDSSNVDDVLISQKDAAITTGIVEKTETWKSAGSSHHNVEKEAAKHNLNTSETMKIADGPTLSDETESESMKAITNKSYVSLGVEAKSDPGNQHRETEANKSSRKNTENFLNASESGVSEQSGSDKVIEANIHDRGHNPNHEPAESASRGLIGNLKSFAYGIRNFWKNL